jgi:predicted DNA-binding protein (UPF0278 family)
MTVELNKSAVDKVVELADKLNDAERAEVVRRILGQGLKVSEATKQELFRRCAMEDAGEVEFRPIEKLQEKLRKKYGHS